MQINKMVIKFYLDKIRMKRYIFKIRDRLQTFKNPPKIKIVFFNFYKKMNQIQEYRHQEKRTNICFSIKIKIKKFNNYNKVISNNNLE